MSTPSLMEAKIRTKQKIEHIYEDSKDEERLFSGFKYYIRTYGCQMNVHDSEEISARAESLGYSRVEKAENADLIIINTCAIRENVHDKVFGFLGRCKHFKKQNPHLVIALGGCMAQEEVVVNEIKNKHPFVDIVFGTHNISELSTMLKEKSKEQKISVYSYEGKVFENISYKRDSNIKAWVNIMYGCDKFCTYCIVPFTRGKQRSRLSKDIIEEINNLVENGYKEVTLLGQNVNAYGKDLEGELDFANLLQEISKINIERIRFVTSHPWDFTHEMIEVIKNNPNIMPYIHLPIQSGSTRILKFMGRRYTKENYLELFDNIKKNIPNVSITTDIIVGFPNETDEDFNETLEVVNYCKFDGAFTFVYSPREGTPAAKIKDNIDIDLKNKRLQELNKLINSYSLENNQKYLNKEVNVLVEGFSEKNKTKVFGYTDTMKLVNIEGNADLIGKVISVKITAAKSFSLDGKAI